MLASFTARLRRSIDPGKARHRFKDNEIDVSFESWPEWQEWQITHPFIFDPAYAHAIAHGVMEKGFVEPLTGRRVAADQITQGEESHLAKV